MLLLAEFIIKAGQLDKVPCQYLRISSSCCLWPKSFNKYVWLNHPAMPSLTYHSCVCVCASACVCMCVCVCCVCVCAWVCTCNIVHAWVSVSVYPSILPSVLGLWTEKKQTSPWKSKKVLERCLPIPVYELEPWCFHKDFFPQQSAFVLTLWWLIVLYQKYILVV